MASKKVKKIFELANKMGPMSESIRSAYLEIMNEMIDELSEEELEELSKSTLRSYADKRKDKLVRHASSTSHDLKKDDKFQRGIKNVNKADKKLKKEDTEDIEELSKKTLGSYVKKASWDAASNAHKSRDREDKKNPPEKKQRIGPFGKSIKRLKGIDRATRKLEK